MTNQIKKLIIEKVSMVPGVMSFANIGDFNKQEDSSINQDVFIKIESINDYQLIKLGIIINFENNLKNIINEIYNSLENLLKKQKNKFHYAVYIRGIK